MFRNNLLSQYKHPYVVRSRSEIEKSENKWKTHKNEKPLHPFKINSDRMRHHSILFQRNSIYSLYDLSSFFLRASRIILSAINNYPPHNVWCLREINRSEFFPRADFALLLFLREFSYDDHIVKDICTKSKSGWQVEG